MTDASDNDDLSALRRLASKLTDDDWVRTQPPAAAWEAIESTVESTVHGFAGDEGSGAYPMALFHHVASDQVLEGDPPIERTTERLRTAPNVRRRHRRYFGVAAMTVVIAGVIGFSLMTADEPEELAQARPTNAGLTEPYGGAATAVAELAGNQQRLVIGFDSPLPDGESLELWLIKPDLSDMTSLGLIGDNEWYVIPPGIDIFEYSLVDVSIEPDDGDPTHSGRSILRGELRPA